MNSYFSGLFKILGIALIFFILIAIFFACSYFWVIWVPVYFALAHTLPVFITILACNGLTLTIIGYSLMYWFADHLK